MFTWHKTHSHEFRHIVSFVVVLKKKLFCTFAYTENVEKSQKTSENRRFTNRLKILMQCRYRNKAVKRKILFMLFRKKLHFRAIYADSTTAHELKGISQSFCDAPASRLITFNPTSFQWLSFTVDERNAFYFIFICNHNQCNEKWNIKIFFNKLIHGIVEV